MCEGGAEGASCDRVKVSLGLGRLIDCDSGCSGHGSCLASGECECDVGFEGHACNQLSGFTSRHSGSSRSTTWKPSFFSSTSSSTSSSAIASSTNINTSASASTGTSTDTSTSSLQQSCMRGCSGRGHCLSVEIPQPRILGAARPASGLTSGLTSGGSIPGSSSSSGSSSSDSSNGSNGPVTRLLRRFKGRVVGAYAYANAAIFGDEDEGSARAGAGAAKPSGPVALACACEPGFGGDDCSRVQPLCFLNCSGAGLCASQLASRGLSRGAGAGRGTPTSAQEKPTIAPPLCLCQKGHMGAGCEFRAAECANDCSGRGSCMRSLKGGVASASCLCAPGHAGESCAFSCEEGCNGHGHCLLIGGLLRGDDISERGAKEGSHSRCLCSQGWGGRTCAKVTTAAE